MELEYPRLYHNLLMIWRRTNGERGCAVRRAPFFLMKLRTCSLSVQPSMFIAVTVLLPFRDVVPMSREKGRYTNLGYTRGWDAQGYDSVELEPLGSERITKCTKSTPWAFYTGK